ncbi:CotH kinase family protein [Ruminococcus sp.]|uniref:CotH kinase family protein n=1 Tax=Ruminococcus sp. TaxID=41978 RepID=UPI0025D4765C|nr:CotH kinase family protein [Ruminococcus sp.]
MNIEFSKTCKKAVTLGILSFFTLVNNVPLITIGADNKKTIVINEVCTKNTTTAAPDGNFYDFVELYNPTDEAISLKGYSISDDVNAPKKYVFPDNAVIKSCGFFVVYCDVKVNSSVEGTTFGLSKDGETLLLSDANNNKLEFIEIPSLSDNTSYGRLPDGSENFGELRELSPGSSNPESAFLISVPTPEFSQKSGFYDSEFKLSLSAPEEYNIYYTLDGSEPTANSMRYDAPITVYDRSSEENVYSAITDIKYGGYTAPEKPVDKAMIVRAIAEDTAGNISPTVSNTYFVGYSVNDYQRNMRVISLVTDPNNLFDDKKGIYVYGKGDDIESSLPNYSMRGKEWERPANITVFENGKALYSTNIGIRIRGGTSREASQKSFTFYARSEYGSRKMEYDFFNGKLKNVNGKVIDSFDTISLRNGGNDEKTKIRDRLNQELAENRDFGTQMQTECILFIDGEFWGLYNITERIDESYVADHYKVKEKDVICVNSNTEHSAEISEMYNQVSDIIYATDSSDLYDRLSKVIDMKNYMNYIAVELIIGNPDSGSNNTAFWKTRTIDSSNPYADGKLRFVIYDTESGQAIYWSTAKEDNNFKSKSITGDWSYSILFSMLKNSEKARTEFMRIYFDLCNENYRADNVLRRLDELISAYKAPMTDTFDRFSYESYLNGQKLELDAEKKYENEVVRLRDYWKVRDNYAKSQLIEYLDDLISGKTYQVTLNNNASQGYIQLNTLTLDCNSGNWHGDYPQELPITLKAVSKSGYKFLRWDISGAEFTSGSETSAEAVLDANCSNVDIKAIYTSEESFTDVLWGDANCDGQVDMSDAVIIMQSLATPNKYGLGGTSPKALTEKGVKQADIDISTVGITGNDALKIQKYLLKLINILEPS